MPKPLHLIRHPSKRAPMPLPMAGSCCPYDPQFVASKGFWVGQPNASQGGGNSWRIGCDMPGADFGIVMIVADVAASWGKHSVTDYAAGRPQIGPGKWVDPDGKR